MCTDVAVVLFARSSRSQDLRSCHHPSEQVSSALVSLCISHSCVSSDRWICYVVLNS